MNKKIIASELMKIAKDLIATSKKYVILCDENGETKCGSDGHCPVDARLSPSSIIEIANKYRNTFKKNFPTKYNFWTHAMITDSISGTGKIYKLD